MNVPKPEPLSDLPEFEVVFAEHSGFVWRVLTRLGVAEREAPDVCQEVFLVVHRRLSEFDAYRGSLRTWLYGICVKAASSHRRRNPTRHEAPDDMLQTLSSSAQPDADLEDRRAWQRLSAVLSEMDSAKREVFVLYELEAISMNEIALILSCPLQTAYARLHAARRRVLAAFQSEETS